MKKFIPQNHKEVETIWTFCTIMIAIILVPFLFLDLRIFLFLELLASPLLYMGFFLFFRKPGLYIENDKLVFKRFLRKHLDVKDVAGLLILKSEYRTRYSYHYIKNRDKSFKYSIIYLKEVSPEFAKFDMGDISFASWGWGLYKEDAYFYTVYDEDVIELFKGKVPIITCK